MSTDIQIGGTVNQPLRDLELRREELFRQIENLGDFRRGIISVNYRKCGKSNCACARKGHPGHGPQDRKSTRLNSSHTVISYAVFCLKKKKKKNIKMNHDINTNLSILIIISKDYT